MLRRRGCLANETDCLVEKGLRMKPPYAAVLTKSQRETKDGLKREQRGVGVKNRPLELARASRLPKRTLNNRKGL